MYMQAYIIKTLRVHTFMQTNSLRLCFYVLIRYSLLFSSEIILKQLFALGSVNIVEQSPRLRLGDYSTIFTEPRQIIVN